MTTVLCAALLASVRPTDAAKLDTKLIEHGWDMPYPTFIRDHVREMEKRPFDGVVLKLQGGRNVFEPTRWAEADFAADFEALGEVKWERFTLPSILSQPPHGARVNGLEGCFCRWKR